MVSNDLETTITKCIHPIETEEVTQCGRASLCWFGSLLPVFFVIVLSATRIDAQARSALLPQVNVLARRAPQAAEHRGSASMEKDEAEHGVSQKPVEIARVFG